MVIYLTVWATFAGTFSVFLAARWLLELSNISENLKQKAYSRGLLDRDSLEFLSSKGSSDMFIGFFLIGNLLFGIFCIILLVFNGFDFFFIVAGGLTFLGVTGKSLRFMIKASSVLRTLSVVSQDEK